MNPEDLAKLLISAAAGTFVGWAGSALTLQGRVGAIENTLARIEYRLDAYVVQRTAETPAEPGKARP